MRLSACLFFITLFALPHANADEKNAIADGSKVPSEVYVNTPLKAGQAFENMKSLVGVWKKERGKSPEFSVSFELIANDTVLVETWLRNDKKHSVTLYHLDNNNLMATHYCPQGNQPRLKLAKNATYSDLRFKFFDATNLASVANSHQHSLGFEFSDDSNEILRRESYISANGEDFSELRLVRSP